jgi:protein tyrosine phosphatase
MNRFSIRDSNSDTKKKKISKQERFNQIQTITPCLDDFNRVVLDPADGLQDSDYINASYVDVSTVLEFLNNQWRLGTE